MSMPDICPSFASSTLRATSTSDMAALPHRPTDEDSIPTGTESAGRLAAPMEFPSPPVLDDPTPPAPRRPWGKLAHAERYRKQRRDLLEAASRCLGSRGPNGAARIGDIVAEAGLSKATFY